MVANFVPILIETVLSINYASKIRSFIFLQNRISVPYCNDRDSLSILSVKWLKHFLIFAGNSNNRKSIH